MDTYEKKYKEAIERAKLYKGLQAEMEFIFPELKESEDERIRKELIEQVIYIVPDKNEVDDNGNTLLCYTTRINKYIAWLEKQEEQNPTPYTEIRKSVCREIAVSLIKYIDNNRHEGNMDLSSIECEDLENAVVNSDWQKVYNYMSKKLEKQGEQKEIDYNEELKKCKANPLYFFDKYVKTKEQKPAWSEEDVIMLKDIISGLEATKQLTYAHDEQGKSQMQDRINWLKSLKDRVKIQSKQQWSDDDIKILEECIELIASIRTCRDDYYSVKENKKKSRCIDWLKSIKPKKQRNQRILGGGMRGRNLRKRKK